LKTLDDWLAEYAVSHQNPTNKNIHRVCVPAIMLSVFGLLSVIPVPAFLAQYSLNFSHIVIVLALLFYSTLSLPITALMVAIVAPMIAIVHVVGVNFSNLLPLYIWIGVFVIAWIGQFIGHKIEGKKPSFFQDLVFLMIGPLWVVAPLFPKYRKV
jgi:uncharacterized membrane protein YGL010W